MFRISKLISVLLVMIAVFIPVHAASGHTGLDGRISQQGRFSIPSQTPDQDPPSPVRARLDGLVYNAVKNQYDLQLSITSPQLVEYVKVAIWDSNSGLKIADLTYTDVQSTNVFPISVQSLADGNTYELRISAISKLDFTAFPIVADDQGKGQIELVHEFEFDLSASNPQLELQAVVQEDNNLILSLGTRNGSRIAKFDGWLINEDSGLVNSDSSFSVNQLTDGRLTILLDDKAVPAGKYKIVIRALTANGSVGDQITSDTVVYRPTRPNGLQRAVQAVFKSPLILFAIVFIIVGTVGLVTYTVARERNQASGLPVLQGFFGSSKSNRSKRKNQAISLPVNANEGVRPRAAEAKPLGTGSISGQATGILVCMSSKTASDLVGKRYIIQRTPYTIGRQGNSLNVSDTSVSRAHVRIDFDVTRKMYTITDLGSRNGTRLQRDGNDPQVLVANKAVVLTPNTLVKIGPDLSFKFS